MRRIGVISDTHGLLRPEALQFLKGSDRILHAGDVGDPAILDALESIAPVVAVRGNVDRGRWAWKLPETDVVQAEGASIYMLHDLAALDIEPKAAGVAVVVSGHSHKPVLETRDGVIYLNPGSAGPRRFKLPISVGEIQVSGERAKARLQEICA